MLYKMLVTAASDSTTTVSEERIARQLKAE
jgi:hypothetical protein